MSKYSEDLKQHLTTYKEERLGVLDCGTYVHRGHERAYGHILPQSLQWLNLLEPIRREIREYLRDRPQVRLQEYFHHLNSSQAFAFNLFYPFMAAGSAEPLLEAMQLPAGVVDWEFEHLADRAEGTYADVLWQTADGVRTYCEVKLTEQEFGRAANDARHREKLATIYRPVLESVVAPHLLETEEFLANYQLMRNVWLAARGTKDRVVFLLPRANESIRPEIERFLGGLSASMARRVHMVMVEDLLNALPGSPHLPPSLVTHVALLREKYLLPTQIRSQVTATTPAAN